MNKNLKKVLLIILIISAVFLLIILPNLNNKKQNKERKYKKDAKVQQELAQLKINLEEYYKENGHYPSEYLDVNDGIFLSGYWTSENRQHYIIYSYESSDLNLNGENKQLNNVYYTTDTIANAFVEFTHNDELYTPFSEIENKMKFITEIGYVYSEGSGLGDDINRIYNPIEQSATRILGVKVRNETPERKVLDTLTKVYDLSNKDKRKNFIEHLKNNNFEKISKEFREKGIKIPKNNKVSKINFADQQLVNVIGDKEKSGERKFKQATAQAIYNTLSEFENAYLDYNYNNKKTLTKEKIMNRENFDNIERQLVLNSKLNNDKEVLEKILNVDKLKLSTLERILTSKAVGLNKSEFNQVINYDNQGNPSVDFDKLIEKIKNIKPKENRFLNTDKYFDILHKVYYLDTNKIFSQNAVKKDYLIEMMNKSDIKEFLKEIYSNQKRYQRSVLRTLNKSL